MGSPRFDLTDKVAIVTGAGRGIGRAVSLAFAQAGADLVAAARTLSEIEETAEMVRDEGRKAIAVPTNVRSVDQVTDLLHTTLDAFGRVDILVNCAGGIPDDITPVFDRYVLNTSPEEWMAEIDLNLNSIFYCCKIIGGTMVKRRKGSIINISSGMGLGAFPGGAAPSVAKAGVIHFTKTLALEWAPFNVRVNCLAPGFTDTPLTAKGWEVHPESRKAALKNIGLGRFATPEEMASVVAFLASPAASFITGETIFASGGQLSMVPPGWTTDYWKKEKR